MKLAFVGLGQMGSAIATNLLQAGNELAVYNRSADKAKALAQAGATVAESPAAACKGAEAVFSMLANDEAVEAVTFGDSGIVAGLDKGAVHLSCSTISVRLARKLADTHASAGQEYLSSPVFGRPDAAAAKRLVIPVAGPSGLIDKMRPVLESIGRLVVVAGSEPWQANLFKLCGNFMISSLLETFGEAFATLRKSGADHAKFFEVIGEVFSSPLYENYGSMILEERYDPAAFALPLGLKDVRLVLEAAHDLAVPMPIASVVRDQYLAAMASGQENLDWSSVAKVAARNAGLEGPQDTNLPARKLPDLAV